MFHTEELGTHVLSGVSLGILKGAFVVITGPSGCGKSTLLSIMGLVDSPTDGRYWLEALDVGKISPSERCVIRNREIGFIFQAPNSIGDLTVYENAALPLNYRGMRAADRTGRVFEALETV